MSKENRKQGLRHLRLFKVRKTYNYQNALRPNIPAGGRGNASWAIFLRKQNGGRLETTIRNHS